jgi:methanogenic corrinoid protein MtbC1
VTTTAGALEAYFQALTEVDAVEATGLVLELLDEGTSVERITAQVLAPAQERVGALWQQGWWSVADEHAATAVTETALSALAVAVGRRRTAQSRHVLLACAEGEWHTLPARMAAAVGGSDDVRVSVVVPSLPAEHLGRRLAVGDVDLLALSCTMPTNLLGAAQSVQAAHDHGVPVLVGGRAFGSTPQRAHAIGADAWAASPEALRDPLPERAHRTTLLQTEVLLLDAVDDATLAIAYDRLLAAFPSMRARRPYQQDGTREDLRWTARSTAAAVLTDDPSVLDEFLAWSVDMVEDLPPAAFVARSAHLVADAVEPVAPVGAQLLRDAADRVLQAGPA